MKKTQVALAALAMLASTAALADVAVKGCVDASVVRTDAGTALGGYGDGCASQIGFYGSEEIGDMKASFNLETGFSTANGAIGNGGNSSSTGVFNRLANIGLGTKATTLTLCMAKSGWIEAAGGGLTAYGMNGVGAPALAIMNGNLSGTSQSGGFFVGNLASLSGDLGVLSYNLQTTVSKAGNTGIVNYFDNSAASGAGSGGGFVVGAGTFGTADSYTTLRVSAPFGTATVNLGYESRKNTTGLDTGKIDYKNIVVSGSLPLEGGFSLNAAYSKQTLGSGNTNPSPGTVGFNNTADQTGYLVGAGYKMSDAIGFGLTYARNNAASAAKMFALSGQYTLSGNTALYANYIDYTNALALNNAGTAQPAIPAGDPGASYTGKLISVGVQQSF